jgi:hypothetical protein
MNSFNSPSTLLSLSQTDEHVDRSAYDEERKVLLNRYAFSEEKLNKGMILRVCLRCFVHLVLGVHV